jgi:hypothetical protein
MSLFDEVDRMTDYIICIVLCDPGISVFTFTINLCVFSYKITIKHKTNFAIPQVNY